MEATKRRGPPTKPKDQVHKMRAVNVNDALWLPFCKLAKRHKLGRSELLRSLIRELLERETET